VVETPLASIPGGEMHDNLDARQVRFLDDRNMAEDAIAGRPARSARNPWRLLIRPVRPEDDVALMELYETLDTDGRHGRFFNAFHPHLDFYTELATVEQPGGAHVVAVLPEAATDEDCIVGEAGYNLLPNGDGELAITVARDWRSCLGPCLLDALVEVAAAAGVPNLQTDVLSVDTQMLALLHSRGAVVMKRSGWSVVRLLIGTAT
jgi:hypothetical protein